MHKLLGSNFVPPNVHFAPTKYKSSLLFRQIFWNLKYLGLDKMRGSKGKFLLTQQQREKPIVHWFSQFSTGFHCLSLFFTALMILHCFTLLFTAFQYFAVQWCRYRHLWMIHGLSILHAPNTYFPHICDHISTYSGQKLSKRKFTRYLAVKVFNSFKWQMLSYKSRIWFDLI